MNYQIYKKSVGVPQGGACSPTLATLCLDELLLKYTHSSIGKIIMYADDGLIFSNSEENIYKIREDLNKIVEVSEPKSGFIKYKGSFCKDLKFCGLVLSFSTNMLSSCTRTGTNLVFSSMNQFLASFHSKVLTYKYSSNEVNAFKNVSVSSFISQNFFDFLKCCPRSNISLFFNSKISGYLLNCLYLGSFSFEIKDRNHFFEGQKLS